VCALFFYFCTISTAHLLTYLKLKHHKLTGYRSVSELDGDVIVTGLCRQVLDRAAAVPVVPAVHLGLRRTLNSKAEASLAGTTRLHSEYCRLVRVTTLQTCNNEMCRTISEWFPGKLCTSDTKKFTIWSHKCVSGMLQYDKIDR